MVVLPIDSFLPEIVARLREARALVLVAEPGAGKTTRVPPAMLAAGLLGKEHPNLVMLQPRRVAARAAASRIAEENGWELGREVGYHVRFERRMGPATRLRVLTEGILTRQLLDDPFVEDVGAVLLDEFHERSLHTDVTIALLREVRQTVREDLMLVVMSATLEAEPVAAFLGGCPIVRVPGRTFPVEVTYSLPSGERLPERVAAAVREVMEEPSRGTGFQPVQATLEGRDVLESESRAHGLQTRATTTQDDVLVFLPGAEEIRRSIERLQTLAAERDLLLLPLHGSLPADEQVRALRPAKQRKVILATNIAETSLTIDGVGTVIDSGLARVAGYDPQRGLDRLDLKRISKASATQRAGRAGRTKSGRCVRMWTRREEAAMEAYEPPEVRRVDLCATVLALHAWGKPDPRTFGWFEAPPEQTLVSAERLLAMLGALDAESGGAITPLGRAMMALPVHPRLGRLLIGAAALGRLEEGAAVAALLSEKDIVVPSYEGREAGPKLVGRSDLLLRMELLEESERARFSPGLRDRGIDAAAARQVAKTRDELLRVGRHVRPPGAPTSVGVRGGRGSAGESDGSSRGSPGERGIRGQTDAPRLPEISRSASLPRDDGRGGAGGRGATDRALAEGRVDPAGRGGAGARAGAVGRAAADSRVVAEGRAGAAGRGDGGGREGVAARGGAGDAGDDEALLKLPLLAYPDRVCRRRAADPAAGAMVGGGGVRLAAESVVRQGEFFLALDARHDERSAKQEALVRVASAVEVEWLGELFPRSVRHERQAVYESARDRVVGRGVSRYLDLPLREDDDAAVDRQTAGRVLAEWVRTRGEIIVRSEEAAGRWMNRLELLKRAMADAQWPAMDALWVGNALADACAGRRSLAELQPAVGGVLRSALAYPLDRLFETEAPETIEVPSGNRIRLEYPEQNGPAGQVLAPVLAVRLQELFGWTDTPRVAGGRVPVKLELLGPNYRPVQVTEDLRNFWATTYFQVRKDLRARYPKHSWPDEPLKAKPEAKGSRRR